jgi:hypothetical protein
MLTSWFSGKNAEFKAASAEFEAGLAERGWLTPAELNAAITKWGTISVLFISLLLALVHYGSHSYIKAEREALAWMTAKQEAVAADIAQRFGYVRPTPVEPAFTIEQWIERESIRIGLDMGVDINPSLPLALMRYESARNKHALSPKGAIGLMQVMPENAAWCGLGKAELVDERKNATCGIKLLAAALKRYKGDPFLALQDYNGGPNCVGGYHEPMRCKESATEAREVIRMALQDIRV